MPIKKRQGNKRICGVGVVVGGGGGGGGGGVGVVGIDLALIPFPPPFQFHCVTLMAFMPSSPRLSLHRIDSR